MCVTLLLTSWEKFVLPMPFLKVHVFKVLITSCETKNTEYGGQKYISLIINGLRFFKYKKYKNKKYPVISDYLKNPHKQNVWHAIVIFPTAFGKLSNSVSTVSIEVKYEFLYLNDTFYTLKTLQWNTHLMCNTLHCRY